MTGMPSDYAALARVAPKQAGEMNAQGMFARSPAVVERIALGAVAGPPVLGPVGSEFGLSTVPATGAPANVLEERILKSWLANGTIFIMFLDYGGRRKMAAWSRRQGMWKVYVPYRPLVLGKRLKVGTVARVVRRLQGEAKQWAKVLNLGPVRRGVRKAKRGRK